jgi:hypothetical protein
MCIFGGSYDVGAHDAMSGYTSGALLAPLFVGAQAQDNSA